MNWRDAIGVCPLCVGWRFYNRSHFCSGTGWTFTLRRELPAKTS